MDSTIPVRLAAVSGALGATAMVIAGIATSMEAPPPMVTFESITIWHRDWPREEPAPLPSRALPAGAVSGLTFRSFPVGAPSGEARLLRGAGFVTEALPATCTTTLCQGAYVHEAEGWFLAPATTRYSFLAMFAGRSWGGVRDFPARCDSSVEMDGEKHGTFLLGKGAHRIRWRTVCAGGGGVPVQLHISRWGEGDGPARTLDPDRHLFTMPLPRGER
ncbi:MAG TPA: hypothetical protein VED40_16650 [Azospirillaceae bacterium]|nr:hypothetical protein [Azospirillaceae bacterium]